MQMLEPSEQQPNLTSEPQVLRNPSHRWHLNRKDAQRCLVASITRNKTKQPSQGYVGRK